MGSSIETGSFCSFDLITSFEVFEHVPDPKSTLEDMLRYLKLDGFMIFSTLLSDGHIEKNGRLTWWYASPRNGHISFHTQKSLQALAKTKGLNFHSFSPGVHMYYRVLPSWAQQALSRRV